MAVFLQKYSKVQEYCKSWTTSNPPKTSNPLKLGVLSTADINTLAIIHPVQNHPDVTLYSIASRSPTHAKSYSQKYRFQRYHTSYSSLISDPAVDIVYISLPNSLHFEWTIRAIENGKHVLVEKPMGSNEIEVRKMKDVWERVEAEFGRKIVVMEAMHWRFHPAAELFREILEEENEEEREETEWVGVGKEFRARQERGEDNESSTLSSDDDDNIPDSTHGYKHRKSRKGTVGRIIRTEAWMTATPALPKTDIRWSFDMSGGSLMDMTYVLSFTRFAIQPCRSERVRHGRHETLYKGEDVRRHPPRAHDGSTGLLRVLSASATSPLPGYTGPPPKPSSSSSSTSTPAPSNPDPRVDASMTSTMLFSSTLNSHGRGSYDVHSTIYTDMSRKWALGGVLPRLWELPSIKVETERKVVFWYNAMMPHLYHYIEVHDKESGEVKYYKRYAPVEGDADENQYEESGGAEAEGKGKGKEKEKATGSRKRHTKEWDVIAEKDHEPDAFTPRGPLGEPLYPREARITHEEPETPGTFKSYKESERDKKQGWSTYRYQLEAFVDMIRGMNLKTKSGEQGGEWVSLEDSVEQMMCIDRVYEKSGLGLRPTSGLLI